MSVKGLAKQMVGYTASIPGTRASKAHIRKLILAMVRQIEVETRTASTDASVTAGSGSTLGEDGYETSEDEYAENVWVPGKAASEEQSDGATARAGGSCAADAGQGGNMAGIPSAPSIEEAADGPVRPVDTSSADQAGCDTEGDGAETCLVGGSPGEEKAQAWHEAPWPLCDACDGWLRRMFA